MTKCVQRNQLHICGTHGKIQTGTEGSFQGIAHKFVLNNFGFFSVDMFLIFSLCMAVYVLLIFIKFAGSLSRRVEF